MSDPAPEGPSLFVHSLPGSFGDLGALGREVALDAGAVLWKEGDPGDHVVLLVEGRLEVVHQAAEGEEITLRYLYPGAVAGEMAALDGEPRSATVRAHAASRVVLVPARSFREFLRARTDVLEQLFWTQLERVRSLTLRVSRTHHRAITDPLTGLYNIGFFRERLSLELDRAQQTGDSVALAIFDIDHFKAYNDRYGHQAGDRCLRDVARAIRHAAGTRPRDCVARYGGEEMIAVLPGADREGGEQVARAILDAVAGLAIPHERSLTQPHVTVSVGVASLRPGRDSSHDLIVRIADRALYLAKEQGRNRHAVLEEADLGEATVVLAARELRTAG